MKKVSYFLIPILFVFVSIPTRAQFPLNSETGKIEYEDIIEIPNSNAKEIHDKVKNWILTNLKSGDQLMNIEDGEDNIVSSGTILVEELRLPYWGKVYSKKTLLNFKFIVKIKDGKLKYNISNIILAYQDSEYSGLTESSLENIKPGQSSWTKKMKATFEDYVYESVNSSINQIIDNFSYSMTKKSEDDW